jgi:HEAT repeat protein
MKFWSILAAALVIAVMATAVGAGEKAAPAEKPAEVDTAKIEEAVLKLGTGNERIRWKAHDFLVKTGEPAVKHLGAALGVSVGKTDASDKPVDEKTAALIKALGSDSFQEREDATKELVKIGGPALEALRKALNSEDLEVRQRTQRIIDKIGGVGTSMDAKEHASFVRTYMVACTLEDIGSKSAAPVLLKALEHKEKIVALAAIGARRKITGKSLGTSVEQLENNRAQVVENWKKLLDKSAAPAAEALNLKENWAVGDKAVIEAGFDRSVLTRPVKGRKVEKKEEDDRRGFGRRNVGGSIFGPNEQGEVKAKDNVHYKCTDTVKKVADSRPVEFERAFSAYDEKSTSDNAMKNLPGFGGAGDSEAYSLKDAVLRFVRKTGVWEVASIKGDVPLPKRLTLAARARALGAVLPGDSIKPGRTWKVSDVAAARFLKTFDGIKDNKLDFDRIDATCTCSGKVKFRGRECAKILLHWDVETFTSKRKGGTINRGNVRMVINGVRIGGLGGDKGFSGRGRISGEVYFDLASGKIVSVRMVLSGYRQMDPASSRFNPSSDYSEKLTIMEFSYSMNMPDFR